MIGASVCCVNEHAAGIAELHQRSPFLLSQLGTCVADDFKRRLTPLGVHPREERGAGGARGQQRPIAAPAVGTAGVHRNVMVSLIDTLEAWGLVKRMPHPDDRRAFAVTSDRQGP